MVTISRKSPFTGVINEMTFDINPEVFDNGYHRWSVLGVLIQDAFPYLSAEEREFIKTGITPAEWDNLFGKED